MPRLLFATSNAHKAEEVSSMLGEDWEVLNLRDFPHLPVPEETGETFSANAVIKALAASDQLTGLYVLADDSGLQQGWDKVKLQISSAVARFGTSSETTGLGNIGATNTAVRTHIF